MLKRRISIAILGTVLFGATTLGAVAQDATPVVPGQSGTTQTQPIVQKGGAAGLVAAVVQVADVIDINDSNIEVVTIEVEDSLNNLTALNNVLNNSPILSNNNIVITDLIEVGSIDSLIAVGVLDGGDLIFFVTGQ